ncbi:hypothetical protein TSAR_001600 [Trichomalopsis sarcophagae]|uniref:EGF-like domain-containing protein n=1 Tax=Trichomalopsis sarcophagae TaxID=543379 RepID=A0A232F0M4_9HYME|nr:hypothetical protein TSAR_001600 [Trichomalopsis sarcophagae]
MSRGSLNQKNVENGVVKRAINSVCQTTENCTVENSECIENVCKCRNGFIIDGSLTKCLRVATGYNEECAESVQCSQFLSVGGSCENGFCVCADGYHYLHGFCHLSKGLNDSCQEDDDCFVGTDYAAASCVDGVCKCSDGFYQRENNTCRRKALEVGGDCIVDSDCVFDEKAKCVSDKCAFEEISEGQPDSIVFDDIFEDNEGSGPSEPTITVGSGCEINENCEPITNSYCSLEKKCTCNRAYFPSKDLAHCVPEIGESCEETETAMMEKTVCKDGLWTCDYIYVGVKSNQLCRKMLRTIGSKCIYPEQCQLFGPRVKCVNEACVCDETSHWLESESFCWLSKKIEESCESDNDCDQPESSPKVLCKSNGGEKKFCTCPEATHVSVDKTYCVKDAPELESYCQSHEDCGSLANVLCSDGKCKCKENYFVSEGTCLAGLDATCDIANDCKQANTVCQNGTNICQCSENYVANPKNECVMKSSYQEQCDYDIQCSSVVPNTYCHFESGSEQNSLENSEAEDKHGRCQCLDAHFHNMNSCFMKRNMGEECSREGECFAQDSKAVCRNGICSCEFGFELKGKQCVKVNSAPSVMNVQTWLLLPSAAFFALKALR